MSSKHLILMETALVWSKASYCKRSNVGAVISLNSRIMSTGYNGTLPGEINICEDENNDTKHTVTHAEQNAILFCAKNGISTKGCSMYITLSPCIHCAKFIIASGIKEVFYLEKYRDIKGIELLKKFNVKTKQIFL